MLTVLSALLVAGLSWLVAYLTRNVENRSILVMAAIFGVPSAGMFLGALLLEGGSHPMLPRTSRGAQIRVAALAVAGTMLVGGLCDAIYVYGGFAAEVSDDLVFMIYEPDVSGSSETDLAAMEIITDIGRRTRGNVNVSVYMFQTSGEKSASVNTYVPMGPLDEAQQARIRATLVDGQKLNPVGYGANYAFDEIAQLHSPRHTRMIFVNSGNVGWGDDVDWALERFAALNASSWELGESTGRGNDEVAVRSGGQHITADQYVTMLDGMRMVTMADGDMVRADTTSAFTLTAIMMLLEGLVIGLGMWLLLSTKGQKRLQVIISPVMAVLGFLLLKVLQPGLPQWML